jgi:hypothetical protein
VENPTNKPTFLGRLPVFSAFPDRKFLFCPVSFPYFTKELTPIFTHNMVTWDRKTFWFDWPQRQPLEQWFKRVHHAFRKPELIQGFFGIGVAAPADVMSKGEVIGKDVLAGGPWNTYSLIEFESPPGMGTRGCPWYLATSTKTGFKILDALAEAPYSQPFERVIASGLQMIIAHPPKLETLVPIPSLESLQSEYGLSEPMDLSMFDPFAER